MAARIIRRHRSGERISLRKAARPYTSLAFANKEFGHALSVRLKQEPLSVIRYVLRESRVGRAQLLGKPFPATIKDLARPLPNAFSENLLDELRWTLAVLQHHFQQLRRFAAERAKIESAILLGKNDEATALLQLLERDLGVSWWSIETSLLIEQRTKGLEGNRTLLKSLQGEGAQPWIKCLTDFYSRRVEDNISAEEYDDSCDIFSPGDEKALYRLRSWSYLRFRLNFQRFADTEFLPFCLVVDESHSLIDRYLGFSRVVQKYFIDLDGPADPALLDLLFQAAAWFPDPHLSFLATFAEPSLLTRTPLSDALFPILHSYTVGDYSDAHSKALAALTQFVSCFDFYELAAKAALRSRVPLKSPFPEGSLPDRILTATHQVVSRDVHTSSGLRGVD